MKTFNHLYGLNGQFVLLEGHSHWHPINDAGWEAAVFLPDCILMQKETFYPTGGFEPLPEQDNVVVFSEEYRKLEQKRLEALALEELARSLKSMQMQYDLESLLEKFHFQLTQEQDIYE